MGLLMKRPAIQRFMEKVEVITETGCWIWTGSLNLQRYGQFHDNGCSVSRMSGNVLAHRWAYNYFKGPLDGYAHVCHRCDVPECVNPDHLWVGTHQDNMADLWAKGRGTRGRRFPERVKDVCKHGHSYTPENTIYAGSKKAKRCRACTARRKAESYHRTKHNEIFGI